jgi:hypothetical protein
VVANDLGGTVTEEPEQRERGRADAVTAEIIRHGGRAAINHGDVSEK